VATVSVLRVLSLSEILSYVPLAGSLLVGDGVVELGEISLLYGPPGSFKGFAVGHLMACGARGYGEWLGHSVNAQFASLWLNCENGRRRLCDQFRKMGLPPDAERFIHVTDIPAIWNLADARLAGEIRRIVVDKQIRLLIIDTVSNFTDDEFAKQFAAFFAALNTLLHGVEPKPAVLLIHHSRKPKDTDKGARGLLNLISGHQTLQRRARSICYLGRVSDDFDEKRMAAVWLKVSNNGEAEGTKTALQLAQDATLQVITDFDWSQWSGASSGSAKHEPKVRKEHIRGLFKDERWLQRSKAVPMLMKIAQVGRSAAYEALRWDGRFVDMLIEHPERDDWIGLRMGEPDRSDADNASEGEPP
jgi:AAA domain